MQIVQPAIHRQRSLRTLLMLGALVLMVLAGLLGMHTLSAEPTGHGPGLANFSVTESAPITHGEVVGVGPVTSVDCGGTCHVSTGDGQGHMDTAMACMLALLVGLFLLVPPWLLHRFGVLPWGSWRLSPLLSTSVLPRPPSLTFLSISRT